MYSFLASKENRQETRDEEKPYILCLRKRWILETPVSFLNTLHSLFVFVSFSPVLVEFFQHLLLLSPLREPGKQAKSHIMWKDKRHRPGLTFFHQYAILEPYHIHFQSQEQQRRLRDARLIYPG
jgi:hypothetical protein